MSESTATQVARDKAVSAVMRFVPNTKLVNYLLDLATIIVCAVSAWMTADGLATVMESRTMANWVAIAMGVAFSVVWISIGHWYPFADAHTQHRARLGVLLFCLLVFFGSTLFSVITVGGRDAVAVGEQETLSDAFSQGLRYYQNGEQETNLVNPLRTYRDIFNQLAEREKSGEVSQAIDPKSGKVVYLTGMGIVYANLRTTAGAFDSFATQVEKTQVERDTAWKSLQDNINNGRDIIVRQNQIHGDYPKWQQTQVEFAGVVGQINKDLAKMASLSSARFLTEANNRITDLLTVIGGGSAQQNAALANIEKPVKAASEVMGKLISENKSSSDLVAPTYTIVPMGYAVFKYWNIIAYAWAIGILLDFLPAIFLYFKSLFVTFFKRREEETVGERKLERKNQLLAELGRLRSAREDANGTPTRYRDLDRRVQTIKAEINGLGV